MAAALAVLDVIEDERVLERTERAGEALRAAIRDAVAGHDAVRDVRGVGLAIGVACRDGATARAVKEGMRSRGVLVGSSGRHGDVLKVRPPLAFTVDEVPIVAAALADVARGGQSSCLRARRRTWYSVGSISPRASRDLSSVTAGSSLGGALRRIAHTMTPMTAPVMTRGRMIDTAIVAMTNPPTSNGRASMPRSLASGRARVSPRRR